MAEYELVWTCEVDEIRPSGMLVFGKENPRGKGSTPEEAFERLMEKLRNENTQLELQIELLRRHRGPSA